MNAKTYLRRLSLPTLVFGRCAIDGADLPHLVAPLHGEPSLRAESHELYVLRLGSSPPLDRVDVRLAGCNVIDRTGRLAHIRVFVLTSTDSVVARVRAAGVPIDREGAWLASSAAVQAFEALEAARYSVAPADPGSSEARPPIAPRRLWSGPGALAREVHREVATLPRLGHPISLPASLAGAIDVEGLGRSVVGPDAWVFQKSPVMLGGEPFVRVRVRGGQGAARML